MVRPRLVEEGKPIGYDDTHDDHDHEMMIHDDVEHRRSASTAALDSQHRTPSAKKDASAPASSSLLRAVGGKIPTPKRKPQRSMKVVIGKNSIDSVHDDNQDTASSHYSNHHQQQQQPPHQCNPHHQQQQHQHTNEMMHFQVHAQHYEIGDSSVTMSNAPPLLQSHFQHSAAGVVDPYKQHLQQPNPLHVQQPDHHIRQQMTAAARPTLPPRQAPAQRGPHQQQNHHHHQHHHEMQFAPHRTHIEIGSDTRPTERMEGVVVPDNEARLRFAPLVVLDGANIAYSYADMVHGDRGSGGYRRHRLEPDARGLSVACQYFLNAGIRVLVVLPAPWLRQNIVVNDSNNDQHQQQRLQILHELRQAGLLVMAPPTDDDDAYCLTIARRENARLDRGPAYVMSNDLFRDAQAREEELAAAAAAGGSQIEANAELILGTWLSVGGKPGGGGDGSGGAGIAVANTASSLQKGQQQQSQHRHRQQEEAAPTGPGRISYTFVDMGQLDDYGDRQLDIVPNPRHPLIAWIEAQGRMNKR
jgi:Zc3h12a-like Ribonuclease NYN domain